MDNMPTASPDSPSLTDESETPTQRQARLRRERRAAKIKAGGSSRLDKITQLSGRPSETVQNPPTANPPADPHETPSQTVNHSAPSDALQSHGDPEEVDISSPEYHQEQRRRRQQPSSQNDSNDTGTGLGTQMEEDIRRMLRAGAQDSQPGAGEEGTQDPAREDPLVAMLSQIMGMPPLGGAGSPDSAQDPSLGGGMPPGLEALLGLGGIAGGGGGRGGGGGVAGLSNLHAGAQAQRSAKANRGIWMWRIVHVVFAMLLGVYLTLHTAFSTPSTLLERTTPPTSSSSQLHQTETKIHFQEQHQQQSIFWIFATAELLLQGTRYFLEQGKEADIFGQGWMKIIGGLLPEPYLGWLRLAGRYSGIWKTVVEDGMVVIWVLGVGRWLMGQGGTN